MNFIFHQMAARHRSKRLLWLFPLSALQMPLQIVQGLIQGKGG